MDRFMRDSDAFSWYMEKDPVLRSTVVVIAWLEGSPDWELLLEKLEAATLVVPVFRERVLEVPGRLATPRWTVDDEFDLDSHIRRVDATEPGSEEVVLDFARHQAMTAFDSARPLWEFTLVERLGAGKAALVMKLHHSLTDGVGGMDLALLLFDRERRGEGPLSLAQAPSPEPLSRSALVREALSHDMSRVSSLVSDGMRSAIPSTVRAVRHPLRVAGEAWDTASSIARTVAPLRETLSPVMRRRSVGRHLEMVDVRLDDLRSAATRAGGTVNDGFLAAVTGALRLYHERHAAPVDSLRVTLPISVRTPQDPMGGNRITLMRFALPVSEPDPRARIGLIDAACRKARSERSIPFTNEIAGALNLLPRGVVGRMLKQVDFLASDVPGFAFPVYLAGARVERYVSFGPTIGSSVNLTLLSYNGTCSIGVCIDKAAIPDHGVFVDCLRQGFDEVLSLRSGKRGTSHRPVRAAT